MHAMPSRRVGFARDDSAPDPVQLARRGNRRRLAVFAAVFVVGLVAGEAWNYARPDLYRTESRLRISVPDPGLPGAAGAQPSTAQATQLQTLDSRPLLAEVAQAMAAAGQPLPAGDDAAAQLQRMLVVAPVKGADVVELRATGTQPALLAALLNTLPGVIRSELIANQASDADAVLANAKQELARLDQTAAASRAQLERYRARADLLGPRDDDEAVARNKGLALALNNAVEKQATADARLRTLTDSAAAGRGLPGRDDPALVALEGRAGQVREALRQMERVYTPDFMAMDPQARALRATLTELQQQLAEQRKASEASALQKAREDLATTRANVDRLRSEVAAERPALRSVSADYAHAKTLEDDLAQIERARRDALERVARLEADQQRRAPTVAVLEPAPVPTLPFGPDRRLDGLRVLGASLLLGLFAMGLVEAFNRAPAASPAVTAMVLPQGWVSAAPGPSGLGWGPATPAALPVSAEAPPALAAPPKRLEQSEAAALLSAATGPARVACALALLGLTVQEMIELRDADLDAEHRRLTVRGPWARVLAVPDWLPGALPAAVPAGEGLLLRGATGQVPAVADVRAWVACAALDAGLPQGAALTPEVLRDTCIAWLVDQGLRFSDLPARVGRIEVDDLSAFADRASASPRRRPDEVETLMPALRLSPLG
jgi:uncharacterized protein involved in exopolysaccharide biosynthesis